MQDIVKRYFWVVGAFAVMACAYFAATTTSHVLEAKYLVDAKTAPKVPVMAREVKTIESRSKVGDPLAKRNMFCADCPTDDPVAVVATGPTDPSVVPVTSLPLVLIATSIATSDEYSFATIFNSDSLKQGGYFGTDIIPGAGAIKEIHHKYVDFTNDSTHRVERIMLFGEAPPPVVKPVAVASLDTVVPVNPDDMSGAFDAGIKKIDDTNYEIDRNLVDKVLANPMAVAKGARVVPSVKDGKPNGFKLYAIRPSSVYAKLGLANGDTIQAINGYDLTSPDKALEVYTKVKEATSLQVAITRRGKDMTVNYAIK